MVEVDQMHIEFPYFIQEYEGSFDMNTTKGAKRMPQRFAKFRFSFEFWKVRYYRSRKIGVFLSQATNNSLEWYRKDKRISLAFHVLQILNKFHRLSC